MTVKLVLIHPAYKHHTIAEAAAAGKINGHNHATSLTYSIRAPIYLGFCGLFSLTESPIKKAEKPEYTAATGKANYISQMCNSMH